MTTMIACKPSLFRCYARWRSHERHKQFYECTCWTLLMPLMWSSMSITSDSYIKWFQPELLNQPYCHLYLIIQFHITNSILRTLRRNKSVLFKWCGQAALTANQYRTSLLTIIELIKVLYNNNHYPLRAIKTHDKV